MKKIALIAALAAVFFAAAAHAQTWQCFSGAVACAPGSPNCTCSQVPVAPPMMPMAAPIVPSCPVMTFWNGVTCQVPAAPAVDTSYFLQQQLLQQQQQQFQRQMEWHRMQEMQQHLAQPGVMQPHLH
jgi:hypothetical protein